MSAPSPISSPPGPADGSPVTAPREPAAPGPGDGAAPPTRAPGGGPGAIALPGLRPGLVLALFAVAALLPWLGALDGPFLFDDQALVRDNSRVHGFGQAASWFTGEFWELRTEYAERAAHVAYWRPLVLASYALDWTLGGGSPVMFHLGNALWHGAASVLALVLARRWFDGAWGPALVAAGVFALHPTRAESVAWIAGRPDPMLTVGCLLAVLGAARRHAGQRGLALEVLGTALAYGSKEQAVVLPLLLAFDASITPGALPGGPARWPTLARRVAPQLALAVGYVLLRRHFVPLHPVSFAHLTPTVRAALFFESLGRYAELVAWPRDLALMRAEVPPPGSERPFFVGHRALGVLTLAAGLAALGWGARRRRRWALPLGLLGGLVLPVSNLVPMGAVSLVAPRLLYLPALGVGALLGVLLLGRARLTAVALGIIGLTTAWTASRAADWSSEARFWGVELRSNPRSPVVLLQQARLDVTDKRPTLGLRRLACALEVDRATERSAETGRYLFAALRLGALSTPDVDTTTLRELERMAAALIDGRPAELQLRGAHFEFHATPAELHALGSVRASLHTERAALLARLGDPAAIVAGEQAVRACPRCQDVALTAADAALRVGRADLALAWARGAGAEQSGWLGGVPFADHVAAAEALRERAAREPAEASAWLLERDVALGAWGAGLARLDAQPGLLATGDLGVLVRRAGVLARAGHPERARAVLAPVLTAEELTAVMDAYALPFPTAPEPALPGFAAGTCALPDELR